jgi:hypothetical protein
LAGPSPGSPLVEEQPNLLDVDLYAMLNPAAEALEAHHP